MCRPKAGICNTSPQTNKKGLETIERLMGPVVGVAPTVTSFIRLNTQVEGEIFCYFLRKLEDAVWYIEF